jgi:predicted ATPase
MITAIEIENFRGFGKRQRIDFSSITLFYGANSSGKSAVLNALLFIHEFLLMENESPERSMLGGRFVNFGSYRDLVFEGEKSRKIHVKIELFLDWTGGSAWDRGYTMQDFTPKEAANTVAIEFVFDSFDNRPRIAKYVLYADDQQLIEIDLVHDIKNHGKLFHTVLYKDYYKATAKYNGKHPCCPDDSDWASEINDVFHVSSKILGGRNFFGHGRNELQPIGTLEEEKDIQRDFFVGWINGIADQLRTELGNFIPLGPLREIPQDFYARRGKDISRVSNGLSAWDKLASLPPNKLEQFNKWLGKNGLDLGYGIFPVIFIPADGWIDNNGQAMYNNHSIRWDIIYDEQNNISSEAMRRIEFYRTTDGEHEPESNDWRLVPTSVGVGLSQIVPVIYHCLETVQQVRFPSKFLSIEQPELHLHPRAQTRLGDLFLECFGDEGDEQTNQGTQISHEQIVAETHSEHLILRILRRIRETTNGKLPTSMKAVETSRVAVYYFSSSEAGTIVKRLHINDQGDFIDNWPNGFFDERLEELF